ncbi:TetR/AcrR family transcriptional regulator [Rufibacter sp. LB8]|uniref:TetR/AcrR family transcriptional regulator n=1 Tax=Rufibacter sp. LB8 TaxID=2777781 RepID=UPI00178C22A3|nr:TetR/AcrR family transcriptional regulator [Rufibacter sp. LB8]
MNSRKTQRETSAQTIQEAALKLFSEQGFDKTSIRQIAQEANISLGLLYNYFKSKEELLHALLVNGRKELQSPQDTPEGLSPFQALEQFVRNTARQVETNPGFWRLQFGLKLQASVLPGLAQELKLEHQKTLRQVTQLLAAAGSTSPSAEAALLLATLDGILQHSLVDAGFPLQDVLIRYLLQLKNHLQA